MGRWGASGSPTVAWRARNLAGCVSTGRYIIGAPSRRAEEASGAILRPPLGWCMVQERVLEVSLPAIPRPAETVILCCFVDRCIKERAIHERFSRRIDLALDRLSARIAHSKTLHPAVVNRQIWPYPTAQPAGRCPIYHYTATRWHTGRLPSPYRVQCCFRRLGELRSRLSWLCFEDPHIIPDRKNSGQAKTRCFEKCSPFALTSLSAASNGQHVEITHQVAF